MNNCGLNNFDIVYYINLEHRKDRYDHINNELNKTNIAPEKINRIDAVYIKDFGILGCGKSHILALEAFLKTPDSILNCVIFEDDFIFTQEQKVCNELIDKFFNSIKDFDVLMLSSNTLKEENTDYSFINRIKNAQTLSGYCVNKKFAPILLENFRDGVFNLEKIGHKEPDYCIDMYVKKLQPKSLWYCINPKIGIQMESYSDIEKCVVSYNC